MMFTKYLRYSIFSLMLCTGGVVAQDPASLANQAVSAYSREDYEAAYNLSQTALAGYKAIGVQDTNTLRIMTIAIRSAYLRGEFQDALKLNRQALRLTDIYLGSNHPYHALLKIQRGYLLRATGKTKRAELFLHSAYQTLNYYCGKSHPMTLTATLALADFYLFDDRALTAKPYFERCITELTAILNRYARTFTATDWERYYPTLKLDVEFLLSFAATKQTLVPEAYNLLLAYRDINFRTIQQVNEKIEKDVSLSTPFNDYKSKRYLLSWFLDIDKFAFNPPPPTPVTNIPVPDANLVNTTRSKNVPIITNETDWQQLRARLQPDEAAIELYRYRAYGWNDNSYVGLGFEYTPKGDSLLVTSVSTKATSQSISLRKGDRIVMINDTSIAGLSQSDIASRLKGEAGTTVRLQVLRGINRLKLNLTLTRTLIEEELYDFSKNPRYAAFIVKSTNPDAPEVVNLENGLEMETIIYKNYLENLKKQTDQDNIAYASFFEKIYKRLNGIKRVYVVADGIYHEINLGALMLFDKTFVNEHLDIRYLNTTAQAGLVGGQLQANGSIRIVAYPDFSLSDKKPIDRAIAAKTPAPDPVIRTAAVLPTRPKSGEDAPKPPAATRTAKPTEKSNKKGIHIVRSYETVQSIAEMYGTTVEDILSLNTLESGYLKVTQQLVVSMPYGGPDPNYIPPTKPQITGKTEEHFVQPQENLWRISKKYGSTVEEIMRMNNLTSTALEVGQRLLVPVVTMVKTVPQPKPAESLPVPTPEENTVPVSSTPLEPVTSTPTDSIRTVTHFVEKGESISDIAKKYGTEVFRIQQANKLNDEKLELGQLLLIPIKLLPPPSPEPVNPYPGLKLGSAPARVADLFKKYNYKVEVLAENLATVDALALSQPVTVLHLTMQGFFERNQSYTWRHGRLMAVPTGRTTVDPLYASGLYFAGGFSNNETLQSGAMSAFKIMSHNLEGVRLVVLASTNPARSKTLNFDAVNTLVTAFRAAGANAVLLSLWETDENASQLFLETFYESVLKGQDRATAFSEATVTVRKQYPHPFQWANFKLIE